MRSTLGLALSLGLTLLALPAAATGLGNADQAALTFFGWSDQHVQVNGDGKHLVAAIDAMNALPGTRYPAGIGGTVAKPAFVLGCGDITEWPTAAARKTYEELITRRLQCPSYDLAGNHDEGGKSPSQTIKRWIIARHGSLSYTFDRGGIHFIALFSKYNESLNSPSQAVHSEALDFLRKDLKRLAKGTPVIVAMHLCFDAITNRDELMDALGNANVICVLGGHYHKAQVNRFRNVNFVQLPSPAPNGPHQVTVLRIASDRMIAVPYDYQNKSWSTDRRCILDVPVGGPARQAAPD